MRGLIAPPGALVETRRPQACLVNGWRGPLPRPGPPTCLHHSWMARTTAGPGCSRPAFRNTSPVGLCRAAASAWALGACTLRRITLGRSTAALRGAAPTVVAPAPPGVGPASLAPWQPGGRAHLEGRVGGGGADHGMKVFVYVGEDLGLKPCRTESTSRRTRSRCRGGCSLTPCTRPLSSTPTSRPPPSLLRKRRTRSAASGA